MLPVFPIQCLLLATTIAFVIASSDTRAQCSSSAIAKPTVFGAEVTSFKAAIFNNWQAIAGNDVCLVNITITHPGTSDSVNNWVALPLTNWNGVFQGIGGGGYAAGTFSAVAAESSLGYAAAMTDAGHDTSAATSGSAFPWALTSTGNVNQYLLLNFAHRSLHEFTVIGKAVTESFYGVPAKHSYWNGCSTGGRQGLVMAQFYPEDYDGILANAPAIQWNDFTPGQQWPFTVIQNDGYIPPPCEFDAVVAATISACDGLDGLIDNIISAPALCSFTVQSLVNKTYTCDTDGTTQRFSQALATIVDKIWQGPRTPDGEFLWYGLTRGANFSTLAPTTSSPNTTIIPMSIADTWFRGFLFKDENSTTANISIADFTNLFSQSHREYDSIMGSASTDLTLFKNRGGKMITWQGLADTTIFPQGAMLYYQKILALDPSAADFYRQFFSPGVGHCGGGIGVIPVDPIGQLRAWVEDGTAPETLRAGSPYAIGQTTAAVVDLTKNARFQDLCVWPAVSKHVGGNPDLESSYACVNGTGWDVFPGPNGGDFEACLGGV